MKVALKMRIVVKKTDSEMEDLGNVDSVFRLRGGSGTSRDAYDPKKGPVHNLDIHLTFHQKTEATNAGKSVI